MNENINKIVITVPDNIQYISQWKDYEFPQGHCVVDKGVTGCGYTEFALRNNKNVVLISPRKLLLENKRDQHKEDKNILYLQNDMKQKDYNTVISFYERISEHLVNCQITHLPIKFMITNDSAHYLIDYLSERNLLDNFYFIADEFQVLFLDSFFKVEIENSFLTNLQKCKNVIYLSATPMQDKYLSEMDEFKDIKFYFLDWSNSPYISKLVINRKHVGSLYTEAGNIIKSFLAGEYPIIVTEDDHRIVRSTEAVLYFNSVNEIIKLVKKFKLNPDQVNILCANTDDNIEALKKIKHEVGKIPLKGEQNKMFTLCTSTCYIGSDFYSDCASTYIFADPNLEHLALDISLDLPQIAGRQRNINNPFKNIINLFYKTLREENAITEERFRALQNRKKRNTLNLINSFNKGTDGEKFAIRDMIEFGGGNYMSNFLSISGSNGISYNKLIEISNERAFRIQQQDYQDDVNVTRVIRESIPFLGDVREYRDKFDKIVDHFMKTEFNSTGIFEQKLKFFCLFMDRYGNIQYIKDQIKYKIPDLRYHNYYNLFRTEGCCAKNWKDANLRRALDDYSNEGKIRRSICNQFKVGDRFSKKALKSSIAEIYRVLGINKTAKASDISNYFEVKSIKIMDPFTKEYENGFEIIKKKELGED